MVSPSLISFGGQPLDLRFDGSGCNLYVVVGNVGAILGQGREEVAHLRLKSEMAETAKSTLRNKLIASQEGN